MFRVTTLDYANLKPTADGQVDYTQDFSERKPVLQLAVS